MAFWNAANVRNKSDITHRIFSRSLSAFLISNAIPVIGAILVVVLYAPVLESSAVRATIGKHLMGIQVCDLSGGRISFRAALVRTFMKIVSALFTHIQAE